MTFALVIAGVLVAAPPEPAGQLPLRLEVGQELIYEGVYTETSARTGARFSRTLKVDTFIMVLSQAGPAADIAFFTRSQATRAAGEEPVIAARLEIGRADVLGRIQFPGKRAKWPRVPMEGPPTLETLAFPARPASLVGGQKWDDPEDAEVRLTWTVAGAPRYQQQQCLMLIGTYQHGDWQREDKVWVRLDGGFALRIERKIEQRTGDFNSTMVAELKSFNPFTLTESERSARRLEIQQCQRFADTLDELLMPRGEPDRRGYDDLLNLIDAHLKNRSQTPYREAILDLRRRTLLARSGERPPEPVIVVPSTVGKPADEGTSAPDFTAADVITGEAVRLGQLRGQPVLLLMFRPSRRTAEWLLKYADEAAKTTAGRVHVLALAVDGQPGAVVELRAKLKAKIPVYGGADVLKLFAGESTPRAVILDKFGTVRLIAQGWGGEYPDWFGKEIAELTRP